MKNVITQDSEFKIFVQEIKTKIQTAHNLALKAVNKELIALYIDIGKTHHTKARELWLGQKRG